MSKRMNFIVIVSDTFRRDHLGIYGNDWMSTPHLDSFAKKALVFDRAYAASYPTVPHRHDLFTGRFTATYMPWAPLPRDEIVLAQVLTDAGYNTMMVSDTNHTLERGYNYQRGFKGWEWIRGQEGDLWLTGKKDMPACDPRRLRYLGDLEHYRNRATWRYESDTFVAQTMTKAAQWLEHSRNRRPFFLYVDTFDPHEPWDPPQWYIDMYDPGYEGEVIDYPHYWYVEGYLTPEELKHCRALYAGEATLVERWTGMLLQKIEDMGLLEDTMVIFTTDHGFLHGEHGIIGKALIYPGTPLKWLPLYDEISHIPFILWMPGARSGRTDALILPPDIMPTILKAAGVEIPESVQGKSFLDVIQGERDEHRECALSFSFAGGAHAVATVTEGNWQASFFPPRPEEGAVEKVSFAVDGLPKRYRVEDEVGQDRLYDLEADPNAEKDISGEHPEVMRKLRQRFIQLLVDCEVDPNIVTCWKEG